MCLCHKIYREQASASGLGIWISSFLSHEVRAKSKIVPLCSGVAFLVFHFFLANSPPFPCYMRLSHEVRAKSKIVPLCSGMAFLVFHLFLANSLPFPCYMRLLRPACNLLAYTGYPDLCFCIRLERSMSC